MHDPGCSQDSIPGSMSSFFRPDAHVAQRSRRDKLRVQQHAPPPAATASQFPSDPISGLPHVRGACDPAMFSSSAAVLDFSAHAHGSALATAEASMVGPSPSGFHDNCSSLTSSRIGDNPCYYKGSESRSSCDWAMLSCVGGGGVVSLSPPMTAPLGTTASHHHQQYRDLHFPEQGLELASVVQPAVTGAGHSWADGGSELVLLPSYGEQTSDSGWMSRPLQQQHWSKGGQGFDAAAMAAGESRGTQGLSLSLSSTPGPEFGVAQFDERLGRGNFAGLSSSRANVDAVLSCPYPKFSAGDRSYGGSLQCVVSPAGDGALRGAGPLGPFTGYATILKNSRFLRPAQQLLDEFCSAVTGLKPSRRWDAGERSRGSASDGRERNSGAHPSSSFPRSTGEAEDSAGGGARHNIRRPEFQQKAKLLYMQEEVCRRYKQYHQQMQLVSTSFESVAGLSSATPYTSLAIKAVSKHFRSLKNAISDQLWHISRLLGEEFLSSPSSSRGDMVSTPRSKYIDQNFRKQKVGENSFGFLENNQPVWRPQRGLPERAVAVLRAWLFEHFLHPNQCMNGAIAGNGTTHARLVFGRYPTDTDKHMLATQTGLSRNQVSNWFINARVRLWKPMVEEIHMLETKGMAGMDLNSADRSDSKHASDDGGRHSSDRQSGAHQGNGPYSCSAMEPVFNGGSSECLEQWHCGKRSRVDECGLPTSASGSLISFAAYPGAMDVGGRGAVSLTLGLHHEGGQQQQQQMSYFGNQMVHDFVG